MDQLAMPGVSPLLLDDLSLPLTPGEYVARNVRVTPLPAAHESPIPALEAMPTVPVMSSDYPHFEGNGDPMGYYKKELEACSDADRASFYGGSLAERFAAMGDPLLTPATETS
jgi:hypothetical protein